MRIASAPNFCSRFSTSGIREHPVKTTQGHRCSIFPGVSLRMVHAGCASLRVTAALLRFATEQTALLGELQLSFVLFVTLSSLRAFKHWQRLSALLCRCGDGLAVNPSLFTAFVGVSGSLGLTV